MLGTDGYTPANPWETISRNHGNHDEISANTGWTPTYPGLFLPKMTYSGDGYMPQAETPHENSFLPHKKKWIHVPASGL